MDTGAKTEDIADLIYFAVDNALIGKQYIQSWGAIADRSVEINNSTNQSFFFGSIQDVLLDAAIMKISKLYENPSRNKTHSVHHIMSELKNYSPKGCVSEVSEEIRKLFDHPYTPSNPEELLGRLCEAAPTPDSCPSLKQIFTARDKIIAHQERLTEVSKEKVSWLPSDGEFIRLFEWAEHACQALIKLCWGARVIPSVQCLEMATNNIINEAVEYAGDN